MTANRRERGAPHPPKPMQVVPDGERTAHAPNARCRCRPATERWTIEGVTVVRVVHRTLDAPEVEPPPATLTS